MYLLVRGTTHFISVLEMKGVELYYLMNKYELLVVLPGTLDDKQTEARANEVLKMVKDVAPDAELVTIGKNRLAYPIKQIRYGYFYTVTFTAEPKNAKLLEEKLRLERDMLRFLLTHFNTHITAQQKIAYSTDTASVVPMVERSAMSPDKIGVAVDGLLGEEEKDSKKAKSVNARPVEKLDMQEITKKLDDLMSGDVIPGV